MKSSVSGMILSGVLLAGLPFLAIAKHWHIESNDVRFEVPSTLFSSFDTENVDSLSEINTLDLSELTGTDNLRVWDTAYLHMAPGPDLIAYPFAITHEMPNTHRDPYAFSIRGTVVEREGDIIRMRYNFETFLPTHDLKPVIEMGAREQGATIELAVNQQAVARLVAVNIEGVRYPYRVIEKPVLKGLTQ